MVQYVFSLTVFISALQLFSYPCVSGANLFPLLAITSSSSSSSLSLQPLHLSILIISSPCGSPLYSLHSLTLALCSSSFFSLFLCRLKMKQQGHTSVGPIALPRQREHINGSYHLHTGSLCIYLVSQSNGHIYTLFCDLI